MAKDKNAPRYDKQGARRVMRKRDYLADLGGQLALGLMANLGRTAQLFLHGQGRTSCRKCWYCIGNLKGD